MSGLAKYFQDTAFEVVDGNIVYASNLNNPLAAIAVGIETMSNDIQTGGSKYATDTGTVNAYAVSLSPAPTSYEEGLEVWLKAGTTCTGPSTIDVNSLGTVEIRRHGLAELADGDISSNYLTLLKYSNGYFQILSASGRGELAADEAEASAAEAAVSLSSAQSASTTSTAQAVISTAQAVIATEQAVIATTKADEAAASADSIDPDTLNASIAAVASDVSDVSDDVVALTSTVSDIDTLVGDGVLGVGQTWANVTASRSSGVTYTNNTGKPISVHITWAVIGDMAPQLNVDSVRVHYCVRRDSSGFTISETVTAVVPPGSTYSSTDTLSGSITVWAELS